MDSAVLGAQIFLAAVFATAAVAKLLDLTGTRVMLTGFGVPFRTAQVLAPVLPLVELGVAVALIPSSTARWGALAGLALLLTFSAGIANAMAHGLTPNCNCFGTIHRTPAGRGTIARNLGFAAVAGFIAWQNPATELGDWVEARTAAELVAVAVSAVALALVAVALKLLFYNRQLERSIATLEARAKQQKPEPEGLPIGTPAPTFELPTTHGEPRSLQSLRAGGRPVLLIFFDPGCSPCHGLVPHVARWQAALADRVAIGLISEVHNLDRARDVWRGLGVDVMLDMDSHVTRTLFKVRGWPAAMAIGRDGRIASDLVDAQESMEVLLRVMLAEVPLDAPAPAPAPAVPTAGAPADGAR